MNKKLAAVAALSAAALTTGAQAESAIPGMYWQDNSISFLYGEDFKGEGASEQTWTLEHASGWVWGDIFFFLDYVRSWDYSGRYNQQDTHYDAAANGNFSSDSNDFYYMEFSPRVSLSWLTDADWSYAPIGLKDTKLAFTYEKGNGGGHFSAENYLMGVGFDWDIPGFAFFESNFYAVRTHNQTRLTIPTFPGPVPVNIQANEKDWTWQVTLAGAYPFSVGEQDFVIDGYLDWRGPSSGQGTLHSTGSSIQAKWDAGKALFDAPRKLYVGAELNYWNNKYGTRGTGWDAANGDRSDGYDQQAMQLLVKYHF